MTKIVFPRCPELISGRLEDPVNFGKFGLKKGTGVDPPPTCGQCPLFLPFFFLWRLPLVVFFGLRVSVSVRVGVRVTVSDKLCQQWIVGAMSFWNIYGYMGL